MSWCYGHEMCCRQPSQATGHTVLEGDTRQRSSVSEQLRWQMAAKMQFALTSLSLSIGKFSRSMRGSGFRLDITTPFGKFEKPSLNNGASGE